MNEENLPNSIMVRSRSAPEIPGISDGDEDGGGSPGPVVHH